MKVSLPKLASAIALAASAVAPAAAGANGPQTFRFHGGGYDSPSAIAVDAAGNAYIGGSVDTAGSDATFAVLKLSPDGTVLWRRTYSGSRGGVGGDAFAVAVDGAGNVYAAGYVGDGVIFNNNLDYLVVKLGPDGTERWAQRYNGPGNNTDLAHHVAVDGAGNVYAGGFSYGLGYDWATLKFSGTGALLWERRHSGPGAADDRPADMALGPDGNLVLTGQTRNTGDGQTADIETLTYDPQGTIVWQRRFTDTAVTHELARDMDLDATGRIAITGTSAENASPYAVPFPITLRYTAAGALIQTIRGQGAGGEAVDLDAAGNLTLAGALIGTPDGSAVARYDAAGARSWLTPLALDSSDGLRVAGVAAGAGGTATLAGTVVELGVGGEDYLTIRYGADGREQWRHRFNGTGGGGDRVAGLAVDGADGTWVTGKSWSGYLSLGGTADDIVTLKFSAGAAPALLAPSDLSATGISSSAIQLGWRDNAGTETGFRIERCQGTGCTGFTEIASVGRDVSSYVDGGLARNTSYSYRVRATGASGNSAYSNVASGKTRRR